MDGSDVDNEFVQVDVEDEVAQAAYPENKTPIFIVRYYFMVIRFLSNYGWYVLGLSIIAYLAWKLMIEPALKNLQKSLRKNEHKKYDSSEVERRQLAMEAHRKKLQEEHDRKATIHAAKVAEREEKKRQEKLEDWERHQAGLGYRSKSHKAAESASVSPTSSIPKPKRRLRDDGFNPLMGSDRGESSSWRPSRRGPAAGGG